MFRKKEKNKIENESKKFVTDFILPLYLNQRFVYDILAIKNDGFTEFFEIKDKIGNSNEQDANIKAKMTKVLEENEISPQLRPEKLTLAQFINLLNALHQEKLI